RVGAREIGARRSRSADAGQRGGRRFHRSRRVEGIRAGDARRGVQRLAMAILLVGTSYRIADIAWRSRLAFAPADLAPWLQDTARDPAIAELFVLSTCNRVEIYAATRDVGAAGIALRRAIARRTGEDLLGPGPGCYLLAGGAAVRHLCRVACGLD